MPFQNTAYTTNQSASIVHHLHMKQQDTHRAFLHNTQCHISPSSRMQTSWQASSSKETIGHVQDDADDRANRVPKTTLASAKVERPCARPNTVVPTPHIHGAGTAIRWHSPPLVYTPRHYNERCGMSCTAAFRQTHVPHTDHHNTYPQQFLTWKHKNDIVGACLPVQATSRHRSHQAAHAHMDTDDDRDPPHIRQRDTSTEHLTEQDSSSSSHSWHSSGVLHLGTD